MALIAAAVVTLLAIYRRGESTFFFRGFTRLVQIPAALNESSPSSCMPIPLPPAVCSAQLEKEALKYADGINKNAAREVQRDADIVAERLLQTCAEPKRDLAKIAADIADLRSKTSSLKPAQSYDLSKDWRLVFASDDDAISTVGTGLHKLPLTRIQVRRKLPTHSRSHVEKSVT